MVKHCLYCGNEFTVGKAGGNQKFCSKLCSNRCHNSNPNRYHKKVICPNCNKEFIKNTPNQKFCCKKCQRVAKHIVLHNDDEKKKASRDMAFKLVVDGRLSIPTALKCLKLGGHSREETEQWLADVKKELPHLFTNGSQYGG